MTFISLKALLIEGIIQSLFSQYEAGSLGFTYPLCDGSMAPPAWAEVPLSKKTAVSEVLYTSAISHLLFAEKNRFQSISLLTVTEENVVQLRKSKFKTINNKEKHQVCELDHTGLNNSVVSQLWNELAIETKRSGWIAFRLSEAGLIDWLVHLKHQLGSLQGLLCYREISSHAHASAAGLTSDNRVWQLQYTYSRCRCLLRLWNQQVDAQYQVKNDTPLCLPPLLCCESDSLGRGRRRVSHRTHRSTCLQVVHSLIEALDYAECDLFWIPYRYPSKQYFLLLKAVAQLCQSLSLFMAEDLSGFGQINASSPASAKREFQARFGLLLVAQEALKVLMDRGLGLECIEAM